MVRSRVVVLSTQPETVVEDIGRALRLLRSRRGRSDAGSLLCLRAAGQGPGDATTPWALEAALDFLAAEHRASPSLRVTAPEGERPNDRSIARLLESGGLHFESLDHASGKPVDVDLPWLKGLLGGRISFDGLCEGRDLVCLSPLRQDDQFGLSGAVDAALSILAPAALRRLDRVDSQAEVERMRLHATVFADRIYLIDATVCGSTNGQNRPQIHNVILAGRDPVACDAIGARLMGIEPAQISWLRSLAEAGLGAIAPTDIELFGESFDGPSARRRWSPKRRRGSRLSSVLTKVSPSRWMRIWRGPHWQRLYRQTPWGLLHHDYQNGTPRTSRRVYQETA